MHRPSISQYAPFRKLIPYSRNAFRQQLNRCTVMQHLGVLERAGLIIVKREGRLRWNYINPLPIKAIHDRWISPHARGAVELLARMKREMEEK